MLFTEKDKQDLISLSKNLCKIRGSIQGDMKMLPKEIERLKEQAAKREKTAKRRKSTTKKATEVLLHRNGELSSAEDYMLIRKGRNEAEMMLINVMHRAQAYQLDEYSEIDLTENKKFRIKRVEPSCCRDLRKHLMRAHSWLTRAMDLLSVEAEYINPRATSAPDEGEENEPRS